MHVAARAYSTFVLREPAPFNMPVIQLAVISEESQAAWGEASPTAKVVIGYMAEHALGQVNAKSVDQIGDVAALWANANGIDEGYTKTMVPSVLHKLSQGVAHAALRREGCPRCFYVHDDFRQRLADELRLAGDAGAVLKPPHRPCVTPGCPYAGTWEPPVEVDSRCPPADFPAGAKCCGSCTGVRRDGRPMAAAHGPRCERVPWLGVPDLDTQAPTWLAITSPSQLNDEVNRAYGTARLVQNELPARAAGVSMEFFYRCELHDGVPANHCQITMTKSEGMGQWEVCMSGPTRAIARLRAQLAFLHCYKTLLEVAGKGQPVDYIATWLSTAEHLLHVEKITTDWVERAADIWTGAMKSDTAQSAPVSVPREADTQSDGGGATEPGSEPGSPGVIRPPVTSGAMPSEVPLPDIWGSGPTTVAHASWTASRAMCAVARHETNVCAYPNQPTSPITKIVAVSELRAALGRGKHTQRMNLGRYTDDELLDGFVAEANAADTNEHGGIRRFSRTTLETTVMHPADENSRSRMQTLGEPCLVVRMSRRS